MIAFVLLDRVALPVVDRRDRGANGEERVGALIDGLGPHGWLAVHDARPDRGNIDQILVGPGGVLTVETKSHRGRVAVDRIDEPCSSRPTPRQRRWNV